VFDIDPVLCALLIIQGISFQEKNFKPWRSSLFLNARGLRH